MKYIQKSQILLLIALLFIVFFVVFYGINKNETKEVNTPEETNLSQFGLNTNTEKRSVDLDQILSGGPGKDGIPAIVKPIFVGISEASIDDQTRGILVSIDEEKRFYPYTILVWHEIVNDTINDTDFAVTFCPLCGSAIVFDRKVNDETLTFKVSGLLFESNLLMYDTKTESLWSQARNEAVVGDYTNTTLKIIDMKLMSFGDLKKHHSDARILSEKTGYKRNYNVDPYTGYGLTEDLYFPVSIADTRFPAKEIMYVIPFEDMSLAFPEKSFRDTMELTIENNTFIAKRLPDSIEVTLDGEVLPGYYEMWFSWATHHQEDGVLWQ